MDKLKQIRQQGLRPNVVAAICHNKKVLFAHHPEYDLWLIPQGGIKPGEDAKQALHREIREELGKKTAAAIKEMSMVGEDKLVFNRPIIMDDIEYQGKYYFIHAIELSGPVEPEAGEFDRFEWVNYARARELAESIYQSGKRRLTLDVVKLLEGKSYIS
jgi:putative (di)nucleoside polyphosphate hydrolase